MAKARDPRQTPMMKQFAEIRAEYPDALLFYRMGDFYELFDEDAVEASKLLGITLTSRNKGVDAVPMAGVPVHSVDDYLRKLVRLKRRVAICEQLEDPAVGKGLVKRGVVRVVTPGTLTENFNDDSACHLIALVRQRDRMALAWCDLGTGQTGVREMAAEQWEESLLDLNVTETIHSEELESDADWICPLARASWQFHADEGRKLAGQVWGAGRTVHVGADWGRAIWMALGGLLHYLEETQKTALKHLRFPEMGTADGALRMDTATVRSLDLLTNHRSGDRQHTLFGTLDRCRTAAGRRLLQGWIGSPLTDAQAIRRRQQAFRVLADDTVARDAVGQALETVYDIERLVTRLSLRRGGPRDLRSLAVSLRGLDDVARAWSERWSVDLLDELKVRLEPLTDLVDVLLDHLVEELPLTLVDGGVLREGIDAELDDLRQARSTAHGWLAEYQAREIESTGLKSLRVAHNRVFGYTIELPRREAEKVPEHFRRQQTLKNVERYITAELKEFEAKLLTARDRSLARECEVYEQLLDKTLQHLEDIQQRAGALAETDVLMALARVAESGGWVLPELAEGRVMDIRGGRHPVVEATLESGSFVPNDLNLDDHRTLLLITGPNMAGKSTYIRQVALITILAQMGAPVPATAMRWSPVDRIHTRIGAADELARGQSTFMVEMAECAHILRSATDRSLLIFDEVGRGTSTLDGLAIARAIVEFLAHDLGAFTLFATHYHELTTLAEVFPAVANANVLVREWGDDIVFLHEVAAGATDRSYGIHVARLAGLPTPLLNRAGQLMNEMRPERLFDEKPPTGSEHQADLFAAPPSKVEQELRSMNVDDLTPKAALDVLYRLRGELGE